jgi:hypothetical protein
MLRQTAAPVAGKDIDAPQVGMQNTRVMPTRYAHILDQYKASLKKRRDAGI